MSTWSDPAKRIAFRQAGFSLATTPRRRGGRDFLILLFTETTEIFRETARNNWDVYGTGRGERRLIGGTYVAERRAARVILLIRLEMGQVGQRSRVPYGNLLPRWLRARIYAARQITISVQRRWGGRGRLSNRVNLPRHILQPFPRVITVDKMEGGSKLCIVYCTMDTMKDPCNRHK